MSQLTIAPEVVDPAALESAIAHLRERRAAEIFGCHLQGIADDRLIELTHADRTRIFNLGYYTWVEQQGIAVEDFDQRRDQAFWTGLQASVPAWDRLIETFNERTGAVPE